MSGEDLRKKIQEAGLSVSEVASRLGMSQANLSGGFKVNDIKTGLLERICAAFNLPMSFFYPDSSSISNVYARGRNVNTGDGTLNAENTGVSDDTVRLLLEQNAKLISIIAEKNK